MWWVFLVFSLFFFNEAYLQAPEKNQQASKSEMSSGNFLVPDFHEIRVLKHLWACQLQACGHRFFSTRI